MFIPGMLSKVEPKQVGSLERAPFHQIRPDARPIQAPRKPKEAFAENRKTYDHKGLGRVVVNGGGGRDAFIRPPLPSVALSL